MRALLSLFVFVLLQGTARAEDTFNPYAQSYVSRMAPPAGPHAQMKIFAGSDKVGDYYRLLEDGYDMIGYSSFQSGNVPPSQLEQQADRLNAEVALVYTRGVANRLVRKPEESDQDQTLYEYFATYWVKLPPPLFGVHVQRENAEDDSGLEVLAVIKASPAANSGLQQGDVLTKIGEVELHKPEQLSQLVQRFAGKTVEVAGRRDGESFTKSVTLNR